MCHLTHQLVRQIARRVFNFIGARKCAHFAARTKCRREIEVVLGRLSFEWRFGGAESRPSAFVGEVGDVSECLYQ